MMKRIIKNKKGALTSIIDSIGNIIQGITNILPAPVLFIIFLFILATVGWVISLIFNATGIYCNSAEQPVQLNANFLTNIALMNQIPDPKDLAKEQINPSQVPILSDLENTQECSSLEDSGSYLILEEGQNIFLANLGIYSRQGARHNITTPTWFYHTSASDCTICTNVKVYETSGLASTYTACVGDVYRKTNEQKTVWNKMFCACEPPEHYYFESTVGKYLCVDNACTGITLGTTWDELLATKGATLLYPASQTTFDPSSENFIGVTCSELRPKLAIYGIDILTYENWLIITVIILLFWIWTLA